MSLFRRKLGIPIFESIFGLLAASGILAIFALVRSELKRAYAAADYSTHAALAKEICDQLAAIPSGQPYPSSLADLDLTFPDGGDRALLERFEYHSDGMTCTIKSLLKDSKSVPVREIVRSFP